MTSEVMRSGGPKSDVQGIDTRPPLSGVPGIPLNTTNITNTVYYVLCSIYREDMGYIILHVVYYAIHEIMGYLDHPREVSRPDTRYDMS